MAVNKLLPFANGVGSNVVDYDTWSALSQILGQGFVTGVARSDYANRLLSQGALASYILGQFVVDETSQDADLNENVFYTNFKNALTAYITSKAVALTGAQTVVGVKTFSSSPIVPTADAADNSQKVASTAFVQGELTSQAVKLTGAQTVDGVKTFSSSPVVPTETAGDNSTNAASTAFVQTEIANQAVKYDSAQTLTDAEKTQARSNIGAPADSEVVKLTGNQTVAGVKTFSSSPIVPTLNRFDTSTKSVNALWAYGLARQGNHLDLVDLGTPDADFWNSIDDGTFSHAPVGGYVTLNGHRYYMAHGNYWLNCGDTKLTKNHMLVVPADILGSGFMHKGQIAGGYAGCDFKTGANDNTGLASLKSIIKDDWGESHILTHREYFTNAVTNGYPSGVAWYDSDIDLMNEPMVYGCKIFELIGTGSPVSNNNTIDKSQIELFRRRPDLLTLTNNWWLRSMSSAYDFANVTSTGAANSNGSAGTRGFRPAFGIVK